MASEGSQDGFAEGFATYDHDLGAEQAAIDALVALAEKSEAGEADGDFIEIRDETHLDQVLDEILEDVLGRLQPVA